MSSGRGVQRPGRRPRRLPGHLPRSLYAALWIGALLIATDALANPFPAELDQLATERRGP
jgi:hypothetical protein